MAEPLLHYGNPETWRKAALRLKEFAPDGVILTWWVTFWGPHFGLLARNLAQFTRVVYLCHNVVPHEKRLLDAGLTRWAMAPARGYIVQCEEDARQLREWFPQASVRRCGHPIYPLGDGPLPDRTAARRALNVTGRMLLFFGFVRPYKGLDVALQALASLGPEWDDLHLWVCGEFWDDAEHYREMIRRLDLSGRVHLETGYQPQAELSLRLAACDAVLLPYRSATGSGVLADAYAHRRPVIATCVGCFQDMVVPEETGLLCRPGDPADLAQAIVHFYAAGAERFQPGLEAALRHYSWDAIVNAVEDLLEYEATDHRSDRVHRQPIGGILP
ncbi:MAG: glycosyltransferase [Candidatus Zixiibacteriota bacterium]|nr:MAG: glycosyltransferase [candidate division Zixibacteria bacterium]